MNIHGTLAADFSSISMGNTMKLTQCIQSNADVQKYEVIWGYFSVVIIEHDVILFKVFICQFEFDDTNKGRFIKGENNQTFKTHFLAKETIFF